MSVANPSYLEKIDYVATRSPGFDFTDYTANPAEWTRGQKVALTREYHKAKLSVAPFDLGRPTKFVDGVEVQRRRSADDYAYMLQVIAPFTKFKRRAGYNPNRVDELSRHDKAKIVRAYRELTSLSSKPFTFHQSRNKKKRAAIDEAIGQAPNKDINGSLVPVTVLGEKPKVTIKRGLLTVKTDVMIRLQFLWSEFGVTPEMLADDTDAAIELVVDYLREQYGESVRYTIQVGNPDGNVYEIGGGGKTHPHWRIAEAVRKLVLKYGSDNYNPTDTSSSWFGNWMQGLTAYVFADVETRQAYTAASAKRREERKRVRKSLGKRVNRGIYTDDDLT